MSAESISGLDRFNQFLNRLTHVLIVKKVWTEARFVSDENINIVAILYQRRDLTLAQITQQLLALVIFRHRLIKVLCAEISAQESDMHAVNRYYSSVGNIVQIRQNRFAFLIAAEELKTFLVP